MQRTKKLNDAPKNSDAGAHDRGLHMISLDQFKSTVVPHLRRAGALPERFVVADDDSFLEDLFTVCANSNRTHWHKQSFMLDRYGTENLDYLTVTALASSAINAYRTLLEAKHRGDTSVMGVSVCRDACDVCIREIGGQIFLVDDLLEAYRNPQQDSIILPHVRCNLNMQDGGGWCRCSWARVSERPPEASQQFEKLVNDLLDSER